MIISYEQLKEHFGGNSTTEVSTNLTRAGVRYFTGKYGKPFTTETALNAAMGLQPKTMLPPQIDKDSEIEIL